MRAGIQQGFKSVDRLHNLALMSGASCTLNNLKNVQLLSLSLSSSFSLSLSLTHNLQLFLFLYSGLAARASYSSPLVYIAKVIEPVTNV